MMFMFSPEAVLGSPVVWCYVTSRIFEFEKYVQSTIQSFQKEKLKRNKDKCVITCVHKD
jgi:hypothetical protein